MAGNLFTRDEGHDMAALADEAVAILREACQAAEDMGMKIAMENHADFTVRELASHPRPGRQPGLRLHASTAANLAFDLDDPLRLARIMAPHALTTHYKNYRILRTREGLALENCALGDGDIDVVADRRDPWPSIIPRSNINIEIHSQFAPFTLDILDETFFQRHPSPPGRRAGLVPEKAWEKRHPEALPDNLPDGEASWALEYEHLKHSAAWAREKLAHLLSS